MTSQRSQAKEEVDQVDLDLDYVRAVGAEIHARLFPRPKRVRNAYGDEVDGPVPYPLPVALRYSPGLQSRRSSIPPGPEGVDFGVLFIPERSIQRIDDDATTEVPSSRIRVVVGEGPQEIESFLVDLTFGEEPELPGEPDSLNGVAITSLLRAVAGVL